MLTDGILEINFIEYYDKNLMLANGVCCHYYCLESCGNIFRVSFREFRSKESCENPTIQENPPLYTIMTGEILTQRSVQPPEGYSHFFSFGESLGNNESNPLRLPFKQLHEVRAIRAMDCSHIIFLCLLLGTVWSHCFDYQ